MRRFNIGEYRVIEHSQNMTGVYDGRGILITSSNSYNNAIKLAKLLNKAYKQGWEDATE